MSVSEQARGLKRIYLFALLVKYTVKYTDLSIKMYAALICVNDVALGKYGSLSV